MIGKMNRQTVVHLILNAYTLDECSSAEEALTRWLTAHPEDLGLHELAGQLGVVKAAALERKAESAMKAAHLPALVPAGR